MTSNYTNYTNQVFSGKPCVAYNLKAQIRKGGLFQILGLFIVQGLKEVQNMCDPLHSETEIQ